MSSSLSLGYTKYLLSTNAGSVPLYLIRNAMVPMINKFISNKEGGLKYLFKRHENLHILHFDHPWSDPTDFLLLNAINKRTKWIAEHHPAQSLFCSLFQLV
eukprot:NODE_371_length_9954_cov_0.100355.p11 type:complete len:101 gc:universal NODE_371_length_9954_cov_0.100355:4723-5025(+)